MLERLPATGGAQLHSEGRKLKTDVVDDGGGRLLVHNFVGEDGASAVRTGTPGEAAVTATQVMLMNKGRRQ